MSGVLDVASLLQADTPDDGATSNVLDVDLGNLMVIDSQSRPTGTNLRKHTTACLQALFNSVFVLEAERTALGPVVTLPPPTMPIPREKPLPANKMLTPWEKFAKEKGITKQKRSRLVWDNDAKEYLPRFGRNKAGSIAEPWALEDNPAKLKAAGVSDPFELKKKEKNEKQSKQRKQEILNKRAEIVSLTGANVSSGNKYREKYEIERALKLAQTSTASLGRFDEKFADEPKIKRKQKAVSGGKGLKREREEVSKRAERVVRRRTEAIAVEKAANQAITAEQIAKKSSKKKSSRNHKK
eukprot:TRINITY_DN10370_c0_g1_i1.p2 TRINITY_DN10370_c0_g1~~TRINITY_DN10370_c0_g1_i1.p2  ORF type:complete len:307 (-),score=105.99 TRINITY_DN10370_c0_g1_i1:1314-2207(-)